MQVSHFKDDVWFDHTALGWVSREFSKEPLQAMIDAAAIEFIPRGEPVIEIGSGIGGLSELLTARTINAHIEGSMKSATLHAQQTDAPVVNGDLYNIPIRDASVASIVGLLVIDAMTDMEKVVAECSRILRPGGKLVYFHDLHASFKAVSTYLRQKNFTPVPLDNLRLAALGQRSFDRFRRIIGKRHSLETAQRLGDALLDSDVQMELWRSEGQEAIAAFTDIIEKDRKLKKTILGNSTTIFANLLGLTLEQSGLTVLHNGPVYDDVLVPRETVTHIVDDFPEDYNVIRFSAFRADTYGYSDQYPDDQVSIGAEILRIVAQKT